MSLIGDLSDPVKDVAALRPLVDHVIDETVARIVPALKEAVSGALDGLTVTITISKKAVE